MSRLRASFLSLLAAVALGIAPMVHAETLLDLQGGSSTGIGGGYGDGAKKPIPSPPPPKERPRKRR